MSDVDFGLQGKVVLVTGASSGFGQRFAPVLARQGANVVVAARRRDPLLALEESIEQDGGRCLAVVMDVSDQASIKSAFDQAEGAFGCVDVVINNAGIGLSNPLLKVTEDEWDRVLDTNLKGAFMVAQEGARRMNSQGKHGSIINIASILGLRVASHLSHYSASKAGLIQLTKSMALELADYGIRVNAICPGYILTDINRDYFETDGGKRMIQRIPQKQLGDIDDLFGPLILLASDASRYMTGSVMTVDGGHSISKL
ncbi:glucose 1-dehydrogenase [Ketobacter sp. MCCC 1A13808]|uniref:SDR family NAD(P)-dependent oxidoreductase n=1 Tax=Ketobacter sp. MCCC 1A13808 TaxID=2602738 RepID=UPI0012EB805C|nr:glucose 1-dehydrogenase [Ketobacter sp. MCCC 1A13808]MVF12384.1 glucose 1-dehydrogenase [Ketobacter sp. MCCC 1A13808]